METDEKIYDLIKKVYLKYLNRAPDKIGLEYFFHQIKDGIILPHDLKETIKQSKEYQDKIKE